MKIIGAGLAGLIAANVFPNAEIIEANKREHIEHKAVLRFRSKVVADVTGIEFRKVRVHKGIWNDGQFVQPSIRLANLYSMKVIGKLADRSIWNIDPVDRYIAPENLIEQLIENCGGRILWNAEFDAADMKMAKKKPIISTMPMPTLADMLHPDDDLPYFERAPIIVSRFRVPGADVFQTVYFTDAWCPIYRASITGDLLIVESMRNIDENDMDPVMEAFGLPLVEPIGQSKQNFGKIAPIDDTWRRNFILRASMDHNIYSVGRFATWRNILLDDVVNDLHVVKRLIKSGNLYSNILEAK